MAQCNVCGMETQLYLGGTPICCVCADKLAAEHAARAKAVTANIMKKAAAGGK